VKAPPLEGKIKLFKSIRRLNKMFKTEFIKNENITRNYLTSETGGTITVSFLEKENTKIVSIMNPKGMGYTKILRNEKEIEKMIKDVKEIIWLTNDEKLETIFTL
jgi:hypothetical protein